MRHMNKVKVMVLSIAMSLAMVFTAQAATYTVAKGDTLYGIGKSFRTTANALMQNNNLKSNMIYPGQKITVPGTNYTVKSGDTFYSIAKRFGTTVYTLMQLNHRTNTTIFPGQMLVIPPAQAAAMQQTTPAVGGGGVAYTASDVDLLARLITAEAEGEPYAAKVAVGAVVLNRVKSGQFPNTIRGVIYQKISGYYQFTPVENGWINKPATAESIRAAKEALAGSDPSRKALFYFDDSSKSQWIWSRPLAARIGHMVYVY